MIRSMTGFGRGRAENETISVTVDIKSVNHRYLEMFVRLPREYVMEEEGVRKLVKENLKRGKVEIFINIETKECESDAVKINIPLAIAYKNALQKLNVELDLGDEIMISHIIKYPDIVSATDSGEDLKKQNVVCILDATNSAIQALVEMRDIEGAKLATDLKMRAKILREKLEKVKSESEDLPLEYMKKLKARLSEMLENTEIPEERIIQELAVFTDKANITEEVVRLESHITQLEEILDNGGDSAGKKMDFLVQEMNREANTIASKANKLEITKISLDMKCEIEKIREQVQNLE